MGETARPLRITKPALLDSDYRTLIISDAVARRNLGSVHDLLVSLGACVDPRDQYSRISQVDIVGKDDATRMHSSKVGRLTHRDGPIGIVPSGSL